VSAEKSVVPQILQRLPHGHVVKESVAVKTRKILFEGLQRFG